MSSAEMKSPMPAPIYGSSEVGEVSTDPFGGNGRDTTWHLVMSDRVAFSGNLNHNTRFARHSRLTREKSLSRRIVAEPDG